MVPLYRRFESDIEEGPFETCGGSRNNPVLRSAENQTSITWKNGTEKDICLLDLLWKITDKAVIKIERVTENKKQFLDLLLLADEQEDMIDKYLSSGDLFALYDDDLKSICVVVPVNDDVCELKNIATYEQYRGKDYGRRLINYISNFYKKDYKAMRRYRRNSCYFIVL